MDVKHCTKCGEAKPLDQFHRARSRPDGRLAQCKQCVLDRQRMYKAENAERISEYHKNRYVEFRESILARNESWRVENLAKQSARVMRYRQRRRKAAPAWLTPEDERRIVAKYMEARWMTLRTGIRHQVDHIIPLQGKSVSGLHVPWNLRVIPARENAKKFNRLQPSYHNAIVRAG